MRTLTVEEVSAVDGGSVATRVVDIFIGLGASTVVNNLGSNPNWEGIPSVSEYGAMP